MILKNNLYTVKSKQVDVSEPQSGLRSIVGSYTLELLPDSFIYQAHFPGEPITPGVCIVQMGKELLEDAIGKPLEIAAVKNVKFLSVISPRETTAITYILKKVEFSEAEGKVKAQLVVMGGDEAKAKLSFTLKVNEETI